MGLPNVSPPLPKEPERMDLFAPVILASQSPRRIELLKKLVTDFEVIPSAVEETLRDDLSPEENAMALAEEKARSVESRHPGRLVIGADTVVALGGEIIGKPKDAEDARRILRRLSGRVHKVITGVAVVFGRSFPAAETSTVRFHPLSEKQIADYVATGEPLDKAGAYAIQGIGEALVASHEGSYSNIVGLPIDTLRALLGRAGEHAPQSGPQQGSAYPNEKNNP
jgi:septum formation protein